MKILSFTTLWPNAKQPFHGLFVRERMNVAARRCELQVVAPIPFFPPIKLLGERYYNYSQIPPRETQGALEVAHPRYLSIPKILKSAEGTLMFYSLLPFVRRMRQRFPFDLLDAHWAYPDGYAASRLARALGVPYTVTVRGSDMTVFAREQGRGYFVRQGLSNAGRVICVSGSLRDEVLAQGIAPDKAVVIENGVDCRKFAPVPQTDARRRLQLPEHARILVSVGHLSEIKGFHVLIDAVRTLPAAPVPVQLMIIGGDAMWGGFQETLQRQIAEFHLEDRVFLVGAKSPEELKYWYSAADLFCLASSREGCPNVVLESLACGTPVLATPVGGIPDILSTPELGLMAQRTPEDLRRGMLDALNRQWDRAKIATHAQDHYSWETTAAKVLNIFERVIYEFQTQNSAHS